MKPSSSGDLMMTDTAQKLPVDTEKKENRSPSAIREWDTFDDLFGDFDRSWQALRSRFWRSPVGRTVSDRFDTGWAPAPAVDVVEADKAFEIKAELPGMDPSQVDVKISDGMLTIRGEKKEEKEEKEENYYLSERRFGSFQRSFKLPDSVDVDNIEASFNNGVLAIMLPKSTQAIEREKKIAIKTS
jgi:HSP20 family protein